MPSLILFCVLQVLDGLTTLVFLRLGVSEGNPLVQFALELSANPLLPIALLKGAGCGLAVIASRYRRPRALRISNIVFAVCVVWNLAAISTGV